MKAFFVSIPHSGEEIPALASWLRGLDEPTLMCDVDRFVDKLYEPALNSLSIPFIKTKYHRYAGDLNRLPEDVDASTVAGSNNAPGKFNRGFIWQITTTRKVLLSEPISKAQHQELVELIYNPFHRAIRSRYEEFKNQGAKSVYHLDAHSMPSLGTSEHRDPGEHRAEIVVSDCQGQSCHKNYLDLVVASYELAGFQVKVNWPYFGGRVTEQYGHPSLGQQAIQVEMNRALYMNEVTKRIVPEAAANIQPKLQKALANILQNLETLEEKS